MATEHSRPGDISFDVSPADAALINEIVVKYADWKKSALGQPVDRLALMMDLTACHANGNPLRLADLLNADAFNFVHDVGGIQRHICRDTGKLLNHFSPRYSARVPEAA